MSRRDLLVLAALPALVAACSGGRDAARAGQTWTCPMHPQIVRDAPGDCPVCGMKLVPVAQSPASASASASAEARRDAAPGAASLTIDPERRRLIGLTTAAVRRTELAGSLRTVGRVAIDETRVARVQPRFDGFVEKLEADFTGQRVKKGQRLVSIYSPELAAAEEELLLAARGREALAASGLPRAESAARERLALLGVSASDVAAVVRTGKPLRAVEVRAPISGYVMTKSVVAGARVAMDQPLFEIADLSTVWLVADVYESDLGRVAVGQEATVTARAWPGRTWRGRVSYLYPTVDERTRTAKVRIDLPNPGGELRPEMLADVILRVAPRRALVVPDDAIIDSGTRELVFVDAGGGRLEPRAVEAGERAGGLAEVRSGLAEGERVATGASFLLDSESSLEAAVRSMGGARTTPPEAAVRSMGGARTTPPEAAVRSMGGARTTPARPTRDGGAP